MTNLNRAVVWADRHVIVWLAALSLVVLCLMTATVVIALRAADTAATTARQQAYHDSTIKADYEACLHSIPSLRAISRHVAGVNELADILVQNSHASIAAAAPDDPLTVTRRRNLVRLERARRKVAAVKSFPVPTEAECSARSGIPQDQRHKPAR